jgi:hypothetical protein
MTASATPMPVAYGAEACALRGGGVEGIDAFVGPRARRTRRVAWKE